MGNHNNLIGLIGSLEFEIIDLRSMIQDKSITNISGIDFISGTLLGRPVVLTCTGGGKVNAAITTTLLIENFSPSVIIFTGVGGGLNPALAVGDVVIGERTLFHDFGEVASDRFIPWKNWEAGTGKPTVPDFSVDPWLLKIAREFVEESRQQRSLQRPLSLKIGTIATGDIFCASSRKRRELYADFNADVIEMDGAAVAQVCLNYKIGCLVIRGISDLTGDDAVAEYEKNNATAIQSAVSVTLGILARVEFPEFMSSSASSR